jgi:hypothetical protein
MLGGRAARCRKFIENYGLVLLLVAEREFPYRAALYGLSHFATSSKQIRPLISGIVNDIKNLKKASFGPFRGSQSRGGTPPLPDVRRHAHSGTRVWDTCMGHVYGTRGAAKGVTGRPRRPRCVVPGIYRKLRGWFCYYTQIVY